MDRGSPIYERILEDMNAGVLTIDSDGNIVTFNAAAARILELPRDQVLGRVFGEVFLIMDGLNDFSEAILDAVYETAVGHQGVVDVTLGGRKRSLALTTSYLRDVQGDKIERLGVISIFSDITELKELRESELRLADKVKAQHTELQDTYRTLEQKNREITAALKKAQVARIAATVFVIGLFVAVGLFAWWDTGLGPSLPSSEIAGAVDDAASTSGPGTTIAVAPRPISSAVLLSGQLAPRREVNVTSSIKGKVASVYFQYGERVVEGQRLIDIDTVEVEREYREAQAAHIKALTHFNKIQDWENDLEVARARRAISKARLELDSSRDKLEETSFLLERGVIPASEHEAAEQRYRNQLLDYEALEQDLQATLARGGPDARRLAELDLANARVRLGELEETLRHTTVHAPVSGVVLQTQRGGDKKGEGGQDDNRIAKGKSVEQGEFLLTIGDLDGLSVVGKVDEVDISKMRVGQKTWISGEAFPGLRLEGAIIHVSSQAQAGEGRSDLPSFEVVAAVENLTPEQREVLRLGMSADLGIIVYDKPDALLVPLTAVRARDGESWLDVADRETGRVREIRVETGLTTLDSVEIVSGLEPGDEVVLPEG